MLLETLGGLRLAGADFSRPKPLLLLAYLAIEGPKDRHYLSQLFWPSAPAPRSNLRVALSQLKRGVPDAVRSDDTRLATDLRVDVATVLDGPAPTNDAALEDLYRGPFLQGLQVPDIGTELEEWIFGTRELVADTLRTRLLDLAEGLAGRGELIVAAKRAEQAWRLAGAPEPAPETYARAYRLLLAGGSPQAARLRTEALDYGVDLGERAAEPDRQGAPATGRAPHNLTQRTSSFEGRDLELVELSRLLVAPDNRLVTLLGPGGVGKTSLALVAANQELRAGSFPGGVYFVGLEESAGEAAVLSAIADALGLEQCDDPLEELSAAIGDRRVLLVLDNCEHLSGRLDLVAALLARCDELTVLATSRDRLNLQGEQLFPVEGLPYPALGERPTADSRYLNSVSLFVKRAKRVQLSFTLDAENLPHVAKICGLVEGSPLAIELAAALIGVLTPREIAEELARDLDVLSAPLLNVPDRHKSLRATFEHSWRLLSRAERAALADLAVFAGGFSREAAARVVGLSIPLLASLIDKALLRGSGVGRYTCHPLVRSFALEKLEQSPNRAEEVLRAHADYFIDLAHRRVGGAGTGRSFAGGAEASGSEAGGAGTSGSRAAHAEHVYAERENYRAALSSAARGGRWTTALRLIAAVWPVWHARGDWQEARSRLDEVIGAFERTGLETLAGPFEDGRASTARALAEAYRGSGILAGAQGDFETAVKHTEVGLELGERLGEPDLVSSLTNHLGVLALHQGDFDAARERLEEALTLRRRSGDRLGVAATLNNLGALAGRQEDIAAAERHYRESLALYREAGQQAAVAILLSNLGDVAAYRGDYVKARELYDESLALNLRRGNRHGVAACSVRLASAHRVIGDLGRACYLCLEAVAAFRELRAVEDLGSCLDEFGQILAAAQRPTAAATAWGAMTSLLARAGAPLPPSDVREHEEAVAAARRSLTAAEFERAWSRGASLSTDEALAFLAEAARSVAASEPSR